MKKLLASLSICSFLAISLATLASAAVKVGSPCSKIGSQIKNSKGYLECREVAGGKFINFQLSKNPQPVLGQKSFEEISNCRVTDQRKTKNMRGNHYKNTGSKLKGFAATKALLNHWLVNEKSVGRNLSDCTPAERRRTLYFPFRGARNRFEIPGNPRSHL